MHGTLTAVVAAFPREDARHRVLAPGCAYA
jgi:hypothetical protein